ncbi:MAG: DedA family protein, partial [Actinomycetota bacterium]
VPAGIAEMNFIKFNIYTFLGVLPWSIGLAYSGFILGANWEKITRYFSVVSLIVIISIVGMIGIFLLKRRKPKTKQESG